jgi:hypothetical protein
LREAAEQGFENSRRVVGGCCVVEVVGLVAEDRRREVVVESWQKMDRFLVQSGLVGIG